MSTQENTNEDDDQDNGQYDDVGCIISSPKYTVHYNVYDITPNI